MKKILLLIASLVLVNIPFKEKSKEEIIIPKDSIRLRVISNSNDEIDIKRKQELKSYVEDILFEMTKDLNNVSEVDKTIINNFDDINLKIKKFLGNDNYKLDYGQNYFPRKVYKGVVYEDGMYNSLVITLGNGKGKNWWCVLFPPLCLMEDNTTTTDVEYQLFISRILDTFK